MSSHVSASALQTADLCNRKYYFERVVKLPVYTGRDYFTFGTVLHAVAERFLRSTAAGQVPLPLLTETVVDLVYQDGIFVGQKVGVPTELFPYTWVGFGIPTGMTDWDSKISTGESLLIQKLISKAISEGMLVRIPDAKVERRFSLQVADLAEMVGVIDYSFPWEAHDHKTTKATKWIKTPEQLAENIQMMVYAKALLSEFGGKPPADILLRHNYFVKDPNNPQIKKVEKQVSVAQVKAFWDGTVTSLTRDILEIRKATEPFEVDGPKPGSNACSAYGGCPYQDICSKTQTVEQYTESTARIAKRPVDPKAGYTFNDLPKESKMGLLQDRFKKATPAPEAVATTATELAKPPWAMNDCTVAGCTDGWNNKGNPCAICVERSGINPEDFEILHTDGTVTIDGFKFIGPKEIQEPKVSETVDVRSSLNVKLDKLKAQSEQIAKQIAEEKAAKLSTGPVILEPVTTPSGVTVGSFELAKPEEVSKRGRKKKTFSLGINCVPIKGKGPIKDLAEIFRDAGKLLATDKGVDSYYELPAFPRRDALAANAEAITEMLAGGTFVCRPDCPDMKAFVDALRPYASEIWEPIANTCTVVEVQKSAT